MSVENVVTGNYLGTSPSSLPDNQNSGVILSKGANLNTIGPDNIIARNAQYGIWVRHDSTQFNTITKNQIFDNGISPIFIDTSSWIKLEAPIISFIDLEGIHGFTVPQGNVEIFYGDQSAARSFLGSSVADETGAFHVTALVDSPSVVATVTDTLGTTSELSNTRTVPMELSELKALLLDDNRIHLQWVTLSEQNNFGFYVQQSSDNQSWQDVGFVAGQGTRNAAFQYDFFDSPGEFTKLCYRLRQIDFEGNESLSESITIIAPPPPEFELSAPFPNPFNASTSISFKLNHDLNVILKIMNLQGATVTTLVEENLTVGDHHVTWNGTDDSGRPVASGIYLIHIIAGNQKNTRKIIFTK